ncbi:MAG: hypothetical protein JRG96_03770 [Deltaproteobacteria bacterium]|nr:hypothetical protein [Deltaproteobacteria bacterium]
MTNWTRVLVRVLVISLALMGSSQAHSDETPGDPELLNGAAKIAHLEWKSASGQEGQPQALTLVNLRESTSPARAGNADYAVMPEGALEGGGPPPLGDPPIELGSGAWVRTKIGNTITYDADVKCGTKKIGTLHFEYYLWKGNSTSNNDPNNIGGAAMAGGFQLDPESTCVLEDGWIWGFVQTVSATRPARTYGEPPPTSGSSIPPTEPIPIIPSNSRDTPTDSRTSHGVFWPLPPIRGTASSRWSART